MDRRTFLCLPIVGITPLPCDLEQRRICRIGQKNKECRYLCREENGECSCLKLDPKFRQIIDRIIPRRFQNYSDSVPLGNNCDGLPFDRRF